MPGLHCVSGLNKSHTNTSYQVFSPMVYSCNFVQVSERIGWVFAIATMLALIYGLYYIQLGPISSAVYVALSHTSWALALSWIIIMCMIGRAGASNP